jgi:hydrogenase nickel incorporation protein HypA/HybF
MHELPLVREILTTLEEKYNDQFDQIVGVEIEAGLLSSIQPILIQNAFEALILDEPQYAKIDLSVKLLPIIAYCNDCCKNFEVIRHKFVCSCGTPSSTIVQGDELRISKVDFLT